MKKLYQYLGFKKPQHNGLLGIEIEAEGVNMNRVDTQFWRSEDDGSLRGHYPDSRAEFVLNKPINPDQVVPALKELVAQLPHAQFDFSYRTSVHVHLNVQDFNHNQLMNLVYTYMLLEEPLMTYCGKSRKSNRFCLRLADAEGLLDIIAKVIKEGEDSYGHFNDTIRYSAINLAAINKYGSVEFRGMRGNMDIDVIQTWTRALVAIHTYAAAQESPIKIREQLEAMGAKMFIQTVLGDVAGSFAYPRLVKEMSRSYSISLDLPYLFEKHKFVPKPEPVYGQLVFIKGGDLEGQMIRDNQVEGREIVYHDNHYKFEHGNYRLIGKYKGPPEEVINAVAPKKVVRKRAVIREEDEV